METIAIAGIMGGIAIATVLCVWWMASKLVDSKNSEANARELAAQRTGELNVAGVKIADANTATGQAVDAANAQQKRGDALEKELADDAKRPPGATGVDELRAQLSVVPASGSAPSGSGGGAGKA